jgi:transcription elongation factor GreA
VPDDDLLMTRADYERVQAEIQELETSARGEMAERIKAARELGDLKENAEYHDAKDAQAILETRILRLRDTIARAQVVAPEGGGDAIAFGSEFEVADRASGKRTAYTLVSAVDADAAQGRLSVESPVAQALLGARAGQIVEMNTPKGARRLEIVAIG